jgi:hypothetical protein
MIKMPASHETQFNPREIHLGFQENKIIMDRFSSEYSGPCLPISIYEVWLKMSRNISNKLQHNLLVITFCSCRKLFISATSGSISGKHLLISLLVV